MRASFVQITFLFFVAWLLSVPMEGPVLHAYGGEGYSRWFLLSHVFMLAITGRWVNASSLNTVSRIGAISTAVLTLCLPLSADFIALFMVALGVTAAPIAVKTCRDLLSSSHPAWSAAWSLFAANLFLVFLQTSSEPSFWLPVLALLPLCTIVSIRILSDDSHSKQQRYWGYLFFVFVFQIVSGLMYGFLYPAYSEQAFQPGLELPFYMLAVVVAPLIYQRDRDLLLVCGLALAMVAFVSLQVGEASSLNFGMFAMQAASGCIDLFLLVLLLDSSRSVATFGYGLGMFCGGIAAGQFLTQALVSFSTPVGVVGGLVLNVAAMTLFLLHKREQGLLTVTGAGVSPARSSSIPADISCLLSGRESEVLLIILGGKNYRETARELNLSESTIKTYMKRIFDKIGVTNRSELLRLLMQD